MAENLYNANIVIAEAIDNGQQMKIRDQNRRTYSFFKTKKDGSETAAYKSYQRFRTGDTVEISYKEVPYKDGRLNNILNIKPATGPVEAVPQVPRVHSAKAAGLSRSGEAKAGGPEREYWEARDATKQNTILLQVAFKAAVELEAAYIEAGGKEDQNRLNRNMREFYDLMSKQLSDVHSSDKEKSVDTGEAIPFE